MHIEKRLAKQRVRRGFRVRNRLRGSGRPRLSVFRSNNHIYAQIIDDVQGVTLVSASTMEASLGGAAGYHGNTAAAVRVGAAIAQRAVEKGLTEVMFDRGTYRYHGRVAALADAARENGLNF
ncbi:MAG: 50S ribosomal protein L18 [Planctomycetaceae bacterium]